MILLGSLPILTACGVYIYFARNDPDRLHTEDHRLRTRILELSESKGGKFKINPVGLVEIANPYAELKKLPLDKGKLLSETAEPEGEEEATDEEREGDE